MKARPLFVIHVEPSSPANHRKRANYLAALPAGPVGADFAGVVSALVSVLVSVVFVVSLVPVGLVVVEVVTVFEAVPEPVFASFFLSQPVNPRQIMVATKANFFILKSFQKYGRCDDSPLHRLSMAANARRIGPNKH